MNYNYEIYMYMYFAHVTISCASIVLQKLISPRNDRGEYDPYLIAIDRFRVPTSVRINLLVINTAMKTPRREQFTRYLFQISLPSLRPLLIPCSPCFVKRLCTSTRGPSKIICKTTTVLQWNVLSKIQQSISATDFRELNAITEPSKCRL